MTTISIAYEVSEEKFQQISQMVADQEIRNVNFNGEDFQIERGDFTGIDGDEYSHVELMSAIQTIIAGY